MNDNTELLKFAVENIEEWPEEWTHLRSDEGEMCFFTSNRCEWDVVYTRWCSDIPDEYEDFLEYRLFSTYTAQVVSKEEWLEGRKENDKSKPENSNTFTKSMLEAGKHIVETQEGQKYTTLGNFFVNLNDGGWLHLDNFDNSLLEKCREDEIFDIVRVYEVELTDYHGTRSVLQSLTLVWSREDKEKVKEREILKKEIDSLKAQLKEAEDKLEELK